MNGCCRLMCAKCCAVAEESGKGKNRNAVCPSHDAVRKKKAAEVGYLERAVGQENHKMIMKKFRFDHPEKGFTEYRQTVVVWCLSDWLRNKAFNEDTFNLLDRQERLKFNALKRGISRGGGADQTTSVKRGSRRQRWRAVKASLVSKTKTKTKSQPEPAGVSTGWILDRLNGPYPYPKTKAK